MPDVRAGSFELGGRLYRFKRARFAWMPGHLEVDARGSRCKLRLVGVPFPRIAELEELPGRVWAPDDDELALYADTFMEGGLEARGRDLSVVGARIECRKYDRGRGILTISFRLEVQDDEFGGDDVVDGVAYCELAGEEEPSV